MEDSQLRDEIRTLLLAGHETTSLGLTFSAWLLSEHPEYQESLAAELRELRPDGPIQAEDLPGLGRVEQVFKESMRLIPPVPIITRSPIEDVELGGFDVPAGTIMIIPQLRVHRDPRFFEDPEEFRPERWTK